MDNKRRTDFYIGIGKWVKSERKRLKITQIQMSKALGLYQSTLSRIEKGEQRLTLFDFEEIRAFFLEKSLKGK